MTISVAMTTYNGEKFIKKQLDSLKNQTRRIDEVIIADDCSQDNTVEIIRQYISGHGLTNWKLILNSKNKGYIENFFSVIENTSGEIIFLCDQDDEWHPDKIEKLSDLLGKDDRILVLNSAVRLIGSDSQPIPVRAKLFHANANIIRRPCKPDELVRFDYKYLAMTNISPGCAICFRKELRDKILEHKAYAVSMDWPHDWYINQLGSLLSGTYYYDHIYTDYRIHENNTLGLKRRCRKPDFTETRARRKERAVKELESFEGIYNDSGIRNRAPAEAEKLLARQFYTFKARAEFTGTPCFSAWLKLLRYPLIYARIMRINGIISDFACIFQS